MRTVGFLVFLTLTPLAAAQEPDPWPYYIPNIRVEAGNQRVDLDWDPARDTNLSEPQVTGYRVFVYDGEVLLLMRETNDTQASFLVTNGRLYALQVAAILSDGTEGQRSYPVAAAPALERDLEYLAAGLIVTWIGIFGYVTYLGRREASLDRKLEQLLSHREGPQP
jgi:CcmD family protein